MKQKRNTPKKSMTRIINEYAGHYSKYQLEGNEHNGKKYSSIVYTPLNNHQNMLYNRALFGLALYSQEEIQEMHWEKRKRIIKVHKRAQSVLNIWKQQLTNNISTMFFNAVFPKTEFADHFEQTTSETDPDFVNKISFKELRISKAQIILKLIQEAILPPNFYELKPLTKCM
jgi:hypothetical protein